MAVSAKDHSVAVGGDVGRDVNIAHIEGEPRPPAYVPPGSHLLFQSNANFTGREDSLKALARALPPFPSPTVGRGVRASPH